MPSTTDLKFYDEIQSRKTRIIRRYIMLPVRHYAANQRQDNQEYFSLILTFRASPAD